MTLLFSLTLMRTGKVKALTPKVEKSNERKVTGRRKKRVASESLTKQPAHQIKTFEQNQTIFYKKELMEMYKSDQKSNRDMYRQNSNRKKPHRFTETHRLQSEY
ncbi:hypothetical protein AKO1_006990 [Acrasis kona]|uniref:Uncharacterized protein n=1 Tax=Acrasis kona TaxID=1008807 RepID=A0AAW2YUT6_9EUKA